MMKRMVLTLTFLILNTYPMIVPTTQQAPLKVYGDNCINTIPGVKRFSENSPTFSPRSQSRDKARELAGMESFMHLNIPIEGCDPWWADFTLIPAYTQSFKPDDIAQCLFGSTAFVDCNRILIQGSAVTDRNSCAWLADYFYLPNDFKGSFTVSPLIRNFLIDTFLYLNMDQWLCGLYFTLAGPFVWSQWHLQYCETIDTVGTNSYPAGYFNPSGIPHQNLLPSFSAFISGEETLAPVDNINFIPLQFSRIDNNARTKIGFADLRFEFGWNFHLKDNDSSRLGVYLAGAAPTGNKKQATFLFDPIIGNGNHWELGMGITAHHIFWADECRDRHLGLYFDACTTHLFGAHEIRTFDLCNKPNSRYMLAARHNQNQTENGSIKAPVEFGLFGNAPTIFAGAAPSVQFKQEYTPVANLTTLNIKAQAAIQVDAIVLMNYTNCAWSFDIGYNFWARTREKFGCPEHCTSVGCAPSLCDPTQQNTWTLKGDSRAYGFITAPNANRNQPIPLSFSQSQATINQGTNAQQPADANDPLYKRNAGIDYPLLAVSSIAVMLGFAPDVADVAGNQIKTSVDPILLSCADIDFVPTRGDTHKIFFNVMYMPCLERERYDWYFGIGGFGEFAHTKCPAKDNCDTQKNPYDRSINCALSQWGVWLKAGLAFYSGS